VENKPTELRHGKTFGRRFPNKSSDLAKPEALIRRTKTTDKMT
jgi:hypothetical protein